MTKLVRIVYGDLETILKWRNSPDVYKWCRQVAPLSMESHVKWFDKIEKDPTIEMFSIFENGRGDTTYGLKGVCGLTDIDYINRRAEFSLYIAPSWQGEGYGETALRLLLDMAFSNFNLNLVWGETFEGNKAIRMFEKIGFKKEATRREFYFNEGKYIDAILYSIKKREINVRLD